MSASAIGGRLRPARHQVGLRLPTRGDDPLPLDVERRVLPGALCFISRPRVAVLAAWRRERVEAAIRGVLMRVPAASDLWRVPVVVEDLAENAQARIGKAERLDDDAV